MSSLFLAVAEGFALLLGCGSTLLWLSVGAGDLRGLVLEVITPAAVLTLCCILSFYYHDLYDLQIVTDMGAFFIRLMQAIGVAFILLAVFYVAFPDTKMAERAFVWSVAVLVGLLVLIRLVIYSIVRSRSFGQRLLVVGGSALAHKLVREIWQRPNCGMRIVGLVDEPGVSEPLAPGVPLMGPLDAIDTIVRDVRPDRVIVALSERRGRLPVRELLEARVKGICVEDGLDAYEQLTGKVALESLTPSKLIFSKDFDTSHLGLALGRALSMLVALCGVVLTAPVMALIALAIKLDSPGPIFFVQERIGLHGRPFKLIKFRTMLVTPSRPSEWVRDNEDRITRVGRWLRAGRLDELPQFINILRGDMNLVGPRPHPVSNGSLFATRIPYYSIRCSVRPGVTGWAQVRYGYANNLEEEIEKMRYDLFYIKRMSLWFDLRILFDSVKTIMFGRGVEVADVYHNELAKVRRA